VRAVIGCTLLFIGVFKDTRVQINLNPRCDILS
jgi:hypothetical protein